MNIGMVDSLHKKNGVDFVHTGPGTLAGSYLRQYWQPVCLSADLQKGRPRAVRVLGEDFTIYRGESGKTYATAHRCPHRRLQLSTGWIEGESIRCSYHGWRFDENGQCVEQPGEPQPFCEKIQIRTYPCVEALGLVFAYFGAAERMPELPRFPSYDGKENTATVLNLACNYFQSLENFCDDVHVSFTHRDSFPHKVLRGGGIARIDARETAEGLVELVHFEQDGNPQTAELNLILPNHVLYEVPFPSPDRTMAFGSGHMHGWYVPIDDESHYLFLALVKFSGDLPLPAFPGSEENKKIVDQAIRDIFDGRRSMSDDNGFLTVPIQDAVAVIGQGRIVDREQERLGRTDVAIVLLRKLWQRSLESITPAVSSQ